MSDWYKLVDKIPVPVDIMEMGNTETGKHLHLTELPNGGRVSTVFLSLDHSFGGGVPVLFETMVFAGDGFDDQDQDRYTTWDEAVEGHWEMVVKHGGTKPLSKEDYEFKLEEDLFTI